jgi:hypothetical protein
MPTLASPQTVTVTANAPNQVYRVKCLGASDVMQVSWVGGGGVSGQQIIRATTTAGQDVGPFQDETTITLTALAGSPSYEYSGPAMLADGGALAGDDGLPVSWAVAKRPSYGQTAVELNAIMNQLSAYGGGSLLFPPSVAPWVFDDELLIPSNVTVILSPGVRITRPDPFTLTGTTTNASTAVTLTSGSTSALKTGYYKAQYVVGTGVPIAARVGSVSSRTVFNLDTNATASGTVSLTFHYAHNVFRRSGATNVRIIAPWGRATIDGNGADSPLTFDSADALRNCIRTDTCTDVETSGVTLTNAHYHGEIGTTNCGVLRYNNIRTLRNGFRGIHLHGDSPADTMADVQMDDIEICQDGYKAWQIQTDQLSSGLFVVFDNMSRVQVGKVRVKDVPGFGVHITGNISGGIRSSLISYESIVCENVGVPLGTINGARGVRIGSVQARGKLITVTGCTLGSGTQQLPLWATSTSYVAGALMQVMTLPGGTDMTKFAIGHAVYLQDITSGLNVKLAVWSVDAANRQLYVFNYNSPTTRPWVIGNDAATGVTATIWTSRGPGWSLGGSDTNNLDLQDIAVSVAQFDTIGDQSVAALNNGTSSRYISGLKIGDLSMRDCYRGAFFYNFTDLHIGSVTSNNSGNRRTGNDTANGDLLLLNGSGATIGRVHLVSKGSGAMTRNGATLLALNTANVSNVKVFDTVVENQNSTGAGIDWTNSVNVMLGDPRTTAGTALTPAGAATNGSAFKYGLT